MKKLKRLIAAALCLALLGGSAALAEQTAYTLRICDPVVTTDGETTLDLTGVTLEAAAAQVQDGFELLLRALGGDQVAAEGVMRWDGSRVALDARGLDGYYTIGSTMDDHRTKRKKQSGFDAQFGLDSLLSDSFFSQLEQACDDYYDSYFQMLLDAQADEGEQTVEDFFTGPVKMHGTSYTLTTQQVLDVQTELTNAILEAMGLGGYYGLYSLGNVPYSVDALPEVETQTFDAEQAEFGSTFGKYDRRAGFRCPIQASSPKSRRPTRSRRSLAPRLESMTEGARFHCPIQASSPRRKITSSPIHTRKYRRSRLRPCMRATRRLRPRCARRSNVATCSS